MIIDVHVHTRRLSPCSVLRAEEILPLYQQAGIRAICLTEHDSTWTAEAITQLTRGLDFVVLRGMEVQTDAGHILVYGLDKWFPGIYRIEKLRQVLDEVGGAMIMAHPYRYATHTWNGPPGERRRERRTVEQAASILGLNMVDAVETINGGSDDDENLMAAEVAKHLGLPATGGSDAHFRSQIGTIVTEFEVPIETEADLIREIKAGRIRARDLTKEPQVAQAPHGNA